MRLLYMILALAVASSAYAEQTHQERLNELCSQAVMETQGKGPLPTPCTKEMTTDVDCAAAPWSANYREHGMCGSLIFWCSVEGFGARSLCPENFVDPPLKTENINKPYPQRPGQTNNFTGIADWLRADMAEWAHWEDGHIHDYGRNGYCPGSGNVPML